jgi:hypothetical protein
MVWLSSHFRESRLFGDPRMIVLMDPPKTKSYKDGCSARVVKVCANECETHFENIDKFVCTKVLYPSMPKLNEIFAMAKVLWKDETSHFPGKTCKDEQEMKRILAMRSYLVQYQDRLASISVAVKELLVKRESQFDHEIMGLFTVANDREVIHGSQALSYISEYIYDLDGGDIVDEQARPTTVTMNGHARGLLFPKVINEKPKRTVVQQFVEESLILGGTFPMQQFTFDYEMILKSNDAIELKTTMENVLVPVGKRLLAKERNYETDEKIVKTLEPGRVYSSRPSWSDAGFDFATSPNEWWIAGLRDCGQAPPFR